MQVIHSVKRLLSRFLIAAVLFPGAPLFAQTALNVSGVTDKTIYSAAVTVNVTTEAGYTYATYLNATNVSSGASYTVRDPDFYLLQVFRTNTSTLALTNRFFRFVIKDPGRTNTEAGLPSHTPLIAIPSASNEFAGGRLRLIAPAVFPSGYEIPVVGWVMDNQNHALRANGWLEADGHPSIFLRRGVGSGFLGATNNPGTLDYSPHIQGVQTNKAITIENATAWTQVSGVLSGNTSWPDNSRIYVSGSLTIPAGSSLTVGAGTIVRLNSRVDITNNGVVTINGSVDQPVIFMPNSRSQPWGGFIMRAGTGQIAASGAIFTGSGAEQGWFGANGNPGSHRDEQALFFVANNQTITLTDCAAMYLAGQLGHSVGGGTYTLTRFLMQGTTTGGEFTGASFRVNDSAFMECPDDSSNFVDGDNDGIYLVSGNHGFTNTLFGWTKDDGVDSGGDGVGTLNYQSCWFESIFHEGNSLSGSKTVFHHDSVFLDCGQGLEDGYHAPNGQADHCLFINCKAALRHGDNYVNNYDYSGFLTATNSLVLFNHRNVFGYNLNNNGWTNASGQMTIRGNWLSRPDTNFPDNVIWDPAADGWRLASFSTAPANGKVGVGLAIRSAPLPIQTLITGVVVRLSMFSTNIISVNYAVESATNTIASGTLQFVPGEIAKQIRVPQAQLQGKSLVRVKLQNPVNADVTAFGAAFFSAASTVTPPTVLIPFGALWKYLDTGEDAGTAWRDLAYDDAAWRGGFAELGFGDGDERTVIRGTNSSGVLILTTYFRQKVNIPNASSYPGFAMRLKRADGAIVYVNDNEMFRSPNMPVGPVDYLTLATSPAKNAIDDFSAPANTVISGTNVFAVEIHQASASSSDLSFDFQLSGLPARALQLVPFHGDWLLTWADSSFILEQANSPIGPWVPIPAPSPVTISLTDPAKFFRLHRP